VQEQSPPPAVAPGDALRAYGWTEDTSERFAALAAGDRTPARIVRVDRGGYLVATRYGVERCHPPRCDRPPGSDAPVGGDWVAVHPEPGVGLVLDEVVPRRTAIRRMDPNGAGEQVLVANVDVLLVLHGLDRPHRVGRIERCCILAWDAGITPVVLLTKSDLLDSGSAAIDLADAMARIRAVVRDVDVLPVSSRTGSGLGLLSPILVPGTTVGLIGESGSGKSTLINRLVGAEVQATAETRARDAKGRHTTTSRRLIPLPSGAVMVDMPGIRTIGMTGNRAGLSEAYADLEHLFAGCRFRDCRHGSEPGCAVRAALAAGRLDEARWSGYQKLLREMTFQARRADERARRSEARRRDRRHWKMREGAEEW
jgi:ribosome biogenesis GTPase